VREIQENTIKQVKELNKAFQDLEVEIETIKKTQMQANLEMENPRMRSGITNISITNRIQEFKERISGLEDTVQEIDLTFKENSKPKKNF
jgi:phage shock protein A